MVRGTTVVPDDVRPCRLPVDSMDLRNLRDVKLRRMLCHKAALADLWSRRELV
jgi:hypothetical protein